MLQRKFRTHHREFSEENLNKVVKFYHLESKADLFFLIGKGTLDKQSMNLNEILNFDQKQLFEKQKKEREEFSKHLSLIKDTVVMEDSEAHLDYTLATCCNPIPGDDIFGFVTVSDGIKIHRTGCPNAPHMLATHGYRVLKAHWASADVTTEKSFLAGIRIVGTDGVGIVRSITEIISNQLNVNMRSIAIDTVDGRFEGTIRLYISDTAHLDRIMGKLKNVEGIVEVS